MASTLFQLADKVSVYVTYPYKFLTYSRESFHYDGETYHYAAFPYTATWRNERCVEVPILLKFLERHRGKNILELGNVSRYFGTFSHDVVDKYEKHRDAINTDIVDYVPRKQYDAIASISTLEHIGFDEEIKDPNKPIQALEALRKMVRTPDNVLIGFPIGYNKHLDRALVENRLPFQRIIFMRRVDQANHWVETTQDEAMANPYGAKFLGANALAFGLGLK
ncbi:hypothetical protein [Oligoflexus tunisiensis]|uniref:hypothetical protein n=1 Tax=Oligoflexus tunisiensis TaxID=708132 RepID=UPI00114CC045|nr:hypothetical protein [Oligoflexus tunisiensis]